MEFRVYYVVTEVRLAFVEADNSVEAERKLLEGNYSPDSDERISIKTQIVSSQEESE